MTTTTPAGAKRVALAAVVVSGVLAGVQDVAKGERPNVRILLGMTVAGALLMLLADYAPPVAGGLGALLLVSSLVNVGAPAFAAIKKGL